MTETLITLGYGSNASIAGVVTQGFLPSGGGGTATSYTLTGPSSVTPGVPSTFTITPNGTTTATVTPSIAGLTGVFSPSTITLNNTTPVMFTFTPNYLGTLSTTNSGGLSNPSPISLTEGGSGGGGTIGLTFC